MENQLHDLLNTSESDLESFEYMEIGIIHRDALSAESHREIPRSYGLLRLMPLGKPEPMPVFKKACVKRNYSNSQLIC